MAELICPVCTKPLEQAGRTFRCTSCNGAWVGEEAVVGMLEERVSTLVELPWKPREDKPRGCADCRADMQTVDLGSVQLDRCPSHGIWFDANELTALFKQAKQFKAVDHEPHVGLLSRLAKLF